MTGGEGAVGRAAAEPREDENLVEIDEGQSRDAPHDVTHERRDALCVIEHVQPRREDADTRLPNLSRSPADRMGNELTIETVREGVKLRR